jgi:hypothetical protein
VPVILSVPFLTPLFMLMSYVISSCSQRKPISRQYALYMLNNSSQKRDDSLPPAADITSRVQFRPSISCLGKMASIISSDCS